MRSRCRRRWVHGAEFRLEASQARRLQGFLRTFASRVLTFRPNRHSRLKILKAFRRKACLVSSYAGELAFSEVKAISKFDLDSINESALVIVSLIADLNILPGQEPDYGAASSVFFKRFF